MSDKARNYAAEHGGAVMIYPPVIEPRPAGFSNVWPSWGGAFGAFRNVRLIELMKQVFGRWPSLN